METENRELVEPKSELIRLITEKASIFRRPVVYLEAGHFDPRLGADEFSVNSLAQACGMLRELVRKCGPKSRFALGILIDNLGLECNAGSCLIKQGELAQGLEEIPQALLDVIASESMVKLDRLILHNERTVKNRAISDLRRLRNRGLPETISVQEQIDFDTLLFDNGENEPIALADVVSANTWRVKCPSILAKHYSDVINEICGRFPMADGVVIVDWSEMFDRSKVEGGRLVFEALFAPAQIPSTVVNVFWGDKIGHFQVLSSSSKTSSLESNHANEVIYAGQ